MPPSSAAVNARPQPAAQGRGRPAQQPSLGERDAEPDEGLHLAPGLHTLGQQPGVDAAAELAEQLGERELDLVGVGTGHERAVQLDQLRPVGRSARARADHPVEHLHPRGADDGGLVVDQGAQAARRQAPAVDDPVEGDGEQQLGDPVAGQAGVEQGLQDPALPRRRLAHGRPSSR
jgi:hypothetical protein